MRCFSPFFNFSIKLAFAFIALLLLPQIGVSQTVKHKISLNVSYDNYLSAIVPTPQRQFFKYLSDGTQISHGIVPTMVPGALVSSSPIIRFPSGQLALSDGASLVVCDQDFTNCEFGFDGAGGAVAQFRNFIFKMSEAGAISRYNTKTLSNESFAILPDNYFVQGITVGLDGNLYALGLLPCEGCPGGSKSAIMAIDPVTMSIIKVVELKTIANSSFPNGGIAVNSAGQLYLTGYTGELSHFSNDGEFISTVQMGESMPAITTNIDIAVDGTLLLAFEDYFTQGTPGHVKLINADLSLQAEFSTPYYEFYLLPHTYAAFDESKCVEAAPRLEILPIKGDVAPGDFASFEVLVTNNDSVLCEGQKFALSIQDSVSSISGFEPNILEVLPGQKVASTLKILTPTNTSMGLHSFNITAAALGSSRSYQASANYSILDTIVPTAPKKLAARVAKGKVTLSWKASSDNIAVSKYQILRNNVAIGSVIGTSLSYVDSKTIKNARYTYTVIAFDAAGNKSAASNAVKVRGK